VFFTRPVDAFGLRQAEDVATSDNNRIISLISLMTYIYCTVDDVHLSDRMHYYTEHSRPSRVIYLSLRQCIRE
jgi:hypothetical protein